MLWKDRAAGPGRAQMCNSPSAAPVGSFQVISLWSFSSLWDPHWPVLLPQDTGTHPLFGLHYFLKAQFTKPDLVYWLISPSTCHHAKNVKANHKN